MDATYRAQITIPPGLDETRLHVEDEHGEHVASVTWRASSNYQSRPADWDWRLNRLGYARRSPWQPDELGFRADAGPITREYS